MKSKTDWQGIVGISGRVSSEYRVSNEMSIKIKKEFNHQRGLVFSYKLNSKIQKKKGNFIEAKLWAYKAYNLAMQIGIKKEIMATGTNLLNLLIENKEINDELDKIIEEIIHLAVELKLPSRLKNIEDILIKLNANKYLDRITFLRNSEQIRIPTVSQYVIHKFEQQLPNKMKNKIELLINQKEAISPSIINGLF